MAIRESKTLVFGKSLANRLLKLANPKNLVVIEAADELVALDSSQPVVAIVDALDSISDHSAITEEFVSRRQQGFPMAIMGVLSWEALSAGNNIQIKTEQLSVFDDLLLLPAKAFEFDLRFAKLEQTASMRTNTTSAVLSVGPLTFDVQSMAVAVHGKHLRLTRKETEFLLFMARNANEVVTKERIAQTVWHIDSPSSSFENVLNGHVSRVREKLGDAGCWGLLRTVRRVGLELSLSSASFREEQKSSEPAVNARTARLANQL
jgi:DNA-binding winged helix-turn-helix (wHTH) protein